MPGAPVPVVPKKAYAAGRKKVCRALAPVNEAVTRKTASVESSGFGLKLTLSDPKLTGAHPPCAAPEGPAMARLREDTAGEAISPATFDCTVLRSGLPSYTGAYANAIPYKAAARAA